jgi:hypothetical protein
VVKYLLLREGSLELYGNCEFVVEGRFYYGGVGEKLHALTTEYERRMDGTGTGLIVGVYGTNTR